MSGARWLQADDASAATPRRIQSLRVYLGMSEAQMAARIGLSLRAYRALEARGRRRDWVTVYCNLAAVTGVSLDWIMSGLPPGVRDWAARQDTVPLGRDGRVLPRPAMERVA